VSALSFSLWSTRPDRPFANRRQGRRQHEAGFFLQIRQHADDKSSAVVGALIIT
jgi:hypothetical protein